MMDELLKQLHDIEGVDPISWWPLAVGWWLVMVVGAIVLGALLFIVINWLIYRRSWKHATIKQLAELEKNLSDATAIATVVMLSEYLRRIALKRFARKECAGLEGDAWLKWLTKQDPKEFDWEKNGISLIDLPYAPLERMEMQSLAKHLVSANQVKDLINATKNWVG